MYFLCDVHILTRVSSRDQVLMVGSHADEVEGGEAVLRSRCEGMSTAVHAELQRYRAAQKQELAELEAAQGRGGEAAAQRLRDLQRVLSQPLRLSAGAIAVSAKTGQGVDELRQMILDAAFDKQAFPTFGSKQPGTYTAIFQKLLRCHSEESSVTWDAMQQSVSAQSELESSQLAVRFVGSKLSSESSDGDENDEAAPEPEPEDAEAAVQLRIVGTVQCKSESRFPKFEDKRAELSRAGILTVEGRAPADLTRPGTRVGQPKKARGGRPFCVQVDCVDPRCQIVLDMGNAEQQQRWLAELRAAAGAVDPSAAVHREYSFTIGAGDVELRRLTICFRSAKAVHKKLQAAGVVAGLTFPGSMFDAAKDFTHTEANWRQRAEQLEGYYRQLIRSQEALSHPVFKENFGFDFADLAERHSRVATKVRKDPELLRRSMTFLGMTGEVICPAFENAPALADRVFLRPSWLVDVMKELVRHDLRERLQALDSATMSNAAQIRSLGQQFLSTGVLDRQLRPWLWRDLQPCIVHDEAQMDFLVDLMEHFGLLVAVPGSDPQQWMLPMRLPERNVMLATATAQGAFAAFLSEIASRSQTGPQELDLPSAARAMVLAQIMSDADMRKGCEVAYRKADEVLAGRTHDEYGLNRHQIAAINFYTQENMSVSGPVEPPVNAYYPMNVALRSQVIEQIRPFWAYIELLQGLALSLSRALFSL